MAALFHFGAGEESRTLDLNLGKVALYQLSYSRFVRHQQQASIIDDSRCLSMVKTLSNKKYCLPYFFTPHGDRGGRSRREGRGEAPIQTPWGLTPAVRVLRGVCRR